MNAKKLVLLVLVVFIGFWLYQDPQGLANVAADGGGKLWSLTTDLFDSVISFVSSFLDQTA
jgi:hypothetical protein